MLLNNIEQFDLDCTYSTGNFWKNLIPLKIKSDLNPQDSETIQANSEDLPFESNTMKAIIFDPPFIIRQGRKNIGKIANRFGYYQSFGQLKKHYLGTLKEAYRLLQERGNFVVKCQDMINSSKNYFTHVWLMNTAIEVGFYPKDLYILVAKSRMNNFKRQYHARKYHAYFWVFEKSKRKIDYSI